MKKKIKIIDILCYISIGEYDRLPKRIRIYGRNDSIYEFKPINDTSLYYYFNINTHERLGSDWKLDGDILNYEVEILDSEDEFEDIEEIRGVVEKDESLTFDEIREGIINNFNLVIEKTNLLIKNQKKITERLNNLDNN